MRAGTIARNGFVVIRIPSTMLSDAAWGRGHHAASRLALIGLVISLFGSVGGGIGATLTVVGNALDAAHSICA